MAEETAQFVAVIPRPVIVVVALRVISPAGKQIRVANRRYGQNIVAAVKDGDCPVHVVLVPLDNGTSAVADFGYAAQGVAVVVVGLAAPLHCQRFVHGTAVGVGSQQRFAVVPLLNDAVVDVVDEVGGHAAVDFGHAPAASIVDVFGCATAIGDAGLPVEDVVGVNAVAVGEGSAVQA